jgi:hypothetical protein
MGLVIAAAITTALAVLAIGGSVAAASHREERGLAAWAVLLALPLQPLAFYLLRLPLDAALKSAFGIGAVWPLVSLLYAPLTEEPAKWLVFAVPAVRRRLRRRAAVPVALAAGLGFGIGEIWLLTHMVVGSPHYLDRAPWAFSAFAIERLEVCILHGAFLLPAVAALATGRSFACGALFGIALHLTANFPIYLAQRGAFGIGRADWMPVLTAWIAGLTFAAVVAAWRLHRSLTRQDAGSVTPAERRVDRAG